MKRFSLFSLLAVLAILAVLLWALAPAPHSPASPAAFQAALAPVSPAPPAPLSVERWTLDVERSLPLSPSPFVFAALPFALPVGLRRKKNRHDRRRDEKLARIHTLYDGQLLARAHEEAVGDTPATTDFVEAKPNGAAARPNAASTTGEQYEARRANAVTAEAAAVSPLLTNYANGYPADAVDQVVEFFAPGVPVPVIFQYRNPALANELGMAPKDQIGATGIPAVVHPDAESLTSGRLLFRGLETPFTAQDMRLAEAMLGNSSATERQRRVRFLVGNIRRGRAYRVYAAVQALAGAATGVTIYTDADPYAALRSYLETVILEAGSPEYVRVCLGYAAFNGFKDHPLANGVSAGLHHDVSTAEVASKLGIPAANLMVSWHQVASTAQGKTASKSVLIGSTQCYIFVCRPTPDEEDNSWIKTFRLAGDTGDLSVYTHQPHPNYEMLGVNYWDKVTETNTSASAYQRLALTFAGTATPE